MKPRLLAVVGLSFLFCGTNVQIPPLDPEIRTDWSDVSVNVRQTSFGLTPSPQANSKGPSQCEAWLGTWDTVTSEGHAFTIQFSKQGDRIFGLIPKVGRGFAGRFDGMPNPVCEEMTFTFIRPATGEVDRGKLRLTTKETFAGTFVKDSAPDKTLTWRGTRKQ